MCGIAGIVAFSPAGTACFDNISNASGTLSKRGPDYEGFFRSNHVVLAHRRLSIIDVSASANQPMQDESGRYQIIFNGEFFNFLEHRDALEKLGVSFKTTSDTEVLLQLYIREGPACLQKVNGFFGLAIFDQEENTVFIARDRMGIKPLWYYHDEDKFIFGSELKSLMAMGIPREIDRISLLNYLQLNYVPGPWSIFENVRKMRPGHYVLIKAGSPQTVQEISFYNIPENSSSTFTGSYQEAQNKLHELLDASVQRRMISDVPLGAFLSGGIDSSVIVALASRHTDKLKTFSIGYKDEPMYDETKFARLVADRYKTDHTEFSLSADDLYRNLFNVLDYLDEPFADSSALAVNILCQETRKYVTVSLSGDGADEMFAGYNKHRAEWILRNRPVFSSLTRMVSPLLRPFEGARNSAIGNRIRQIHRFAEGAAMTASERYWRWCSFIEEGEIDQMIDFTYENRNYFRRKKEILHPFGSGSTLQDVLRMDMHMVLPNDMLVKVDMMSMANSLEVRVPFLDYTVVDFAFSLPDHWKMDAAFSKKILRETFRKELPQELFNRGKHGFEVPLIKWFRTGLRSLIEDDLLSEKLIDRQGLFCYQEIAALKKRLFSSHPGEIEARIWGLIVFQYWWKKYMD
jgi:asparagine synthase (glutamine-hydrolysing)